MANITSGPKLIPTPLPKNYSLRTCTPTVETYTHLRHVSGLSPRSPHLARIGLAQTLRGVQVLHVPSGEFVGMGRIVGDGAMFFQVVDVAIEPDHQGRGLGKAVVGDLVRWVRAYVQGIMREAIEDEFEEGDGQGEGMVEEEEGCGAYVGLIADGEAWKLYGQFGFEDVGPESRGMAFIL